MKFILSSISVVLLCAATPTATVDDEDCAVSVTLIDWAGWGIDNCVDPCGTGTCSEGSRTDGNDVIAFCGCSVGGEPECCHMVLVSTSLGPFLPEAIGLCGAGNGCDAGTECTESGTTTRKGVCN